MSLAHIGDVAALKTALAYYPAKCSEHRQPEEVQTTL
ncbi:hypothetical protein P378_11610 [Desulforamulus profundi]|uniref:Uncharacterized protein n=1 Tax=Desulforamulus profundi TaxID=1383067 RepID=A0A2C6MEX4_9FIRM|nr:hypothetical protein P378_11610 [Desulforamulus profundi]